MLTVARLASERKVLRIVCDQIGAPTSGRAIAGAMRQIIETGLPSLHSRMGGCVTVNITCSGETSWFGFAEAIVDGLRRRNLEVMAGRIIPIKSEEYPTRAVRPHNSRLDPTRAREVFAIRMPTWQQALDVELAALAELRGLSIASLTPLSLVKLEQASRVHQE